MKQTQTTFDKAPNIQGTMINKVPGLNEQPNDYELLFNKPTASTGSQYFAMDIWSSSGAMGDGTFRDVNLIGADGDRETSYSQEIIVGLGSTTAKITRSENITPVSNIFTITSGQVFSITSYFNSATQTIRINRTGSSIRYIRAGATPLDINSANQELIFINSGTTDISVKLTYATSASDRPIFGFLIQIIG